MWLLLHILPLQKFSDFQEKVLYNKHMNYKKNKHLYKKWFWRANYPVAVALYFLVDEKIILFYTLLCSVYANEETSAGAEEAKLAQD